MNTKTAINLILGIGVLLGVGLGAAALALSLVALNQNDGQNSGDPGAYSQNFSRASWGVGFARGFSEAGRVGQAGPAGQAGRYGTPTGALGGWSAYGGPADEEDAAYLRELCLAGSDFQKSMLQSEAMERAAAGGDRTLAADLLEPIKELAAALDRIAAPDDIAEFHAAAVDQFEQIAAALESTDAAGGDLEMALDTLGGALASASPDVLARLAMAANSVPECYGSGFLLGLLGGGG